jgi:hypothetical protein
MVMDHSFQSKSGLSFARNIQIACDGRTLGVFDSCGIWALAHFERLSPILLLDGVCLSGFWKAFVPPDTIVRREA